MSQSRSRTCVIFNPTARGEKAAQLRRHLIRAATDCSLWATQRTGDARTLAAQAVVDGYETVVAAGGDGTINEVLNGIADANGLDQVRLGILPIGTVNVFAQELDLPRQWPEAWQRILAGREIRIDLPELQFHSGARAGERQCFIQMAGAGWDARAIQLVDWSWKKRIGQYAYILSGLRALRSHHPLISVTSGAQSYSGEFVILGNGRFYAGRFSVFHQANFQDGLFDVCIFPRVNWFVLARYLWGFLSRTPAHLRREIYFQSSHIDLSATEPLPVQVDGEVVGQLPARCIIQRQVLRVVV